MVGLRSRIEIVSVNPYVRLSRDETTRVREAWRGPMPVRFTVEGGSQTSWRTNLMPLADGSYRLYLNGLVRGASHLAVGDTVSLDVQFDADYRGGPQHPMPAWFSSRLDENPSARLTWERLPPSRRKEVLRYFARLKSNEAKKRNAERAMLVLSGRRARFMGRVWNDGGSDRNQAKEARSRPRGGRR